MKKLISRSFIAATLLWVVSCQEDISNDLSPTQSQDISASVKGFSELGDLKPGSLFNTITEKPEYKKPLVVSSSRTNATVTLYSAVSDLLAECPDLPTEDFEGSDVPDGGVLGCGLSISSIANGCFDEGVLLPGFEFTATGGSQILSLGAGIGGSSKTVAPDLFASNPIINFSAPNPTVVGFDLLGFGSTSTITVNGTSGVIWSGTATLNSYFGISVSGDVITSIVFDNQPGGVTAEVLDNLTFGTCIVDTDGDGCTDDNDEIINSNTEATVIIDGCDTGVLNKITSDSCGITMSDLMDALEGGEHRNHGQFVSSVAKLVNGWQDSGLITNKEKGAIMSCAGKSNIPS